MPRWEDERGRDFFGVVAVASFLSVGDFVTSLIERLAFMGPGFFLIAEFPTNMYENRKLMMESIPVTELQDLK